MTYSESDDVEDSERPDIGQLSGSLNNISDIDYDMDSDDYGIERAPLNTSGLVFNENDAESDIVYGNNWLSHRPSKPLESYTLYWAFLLAGATIQLPYSALAILYDTGGKDSTFATVRSDMAIFVIVQMVTLITLYFAIETAGKSDHSFSSVLSCDINQPSLPYDAPSFDDELSHLSSQLSDVSDNNNNQIIDNDDDEISNSNLNENDPFLSNTLRTSPRIARLRPIYYIMVNFGKPLKRAIRKGWRLFAAKIIDISLIKISFSAIIVQLLTQIFGTRHVLSFANGLLTGVLENKIYREATLREGFALQAVATGQSFINIIISIVNIVSIILLSSHSSHGHKDIVNIHALSSSDSNLEPIKFPTFIFGTIRLLLSYTKITPTGLLSVLIFSFTSIISSMLLIPVKEQPYMVYTSPSLEPGLCSNSCIDGNIHDDENGDENDDENGESDELNRLMPVINKPQASSLTTPLSSEITDTSIGVDPLGPILSSVTVKAIWEVIKRPIRALFIISLQTYAVYPDFITRIKSTNTWKVIKVPAKIEPLSLSNDEHKFWDYFFAPIMILIFNICIFIGTFVLLFRRYRPKNAKSLRIIERFLIPSRVILTLIIILFTNVVFIYSNQDRKSSSNDLFSWALSKFSFVDSHHSIVNKIKARTYIIPNWLYLIVIIMFGLSHGYLNTLPMMHSSELLDTRHEKEIIGSTISIAATLSLLLGYFLSYLAQNFLRHLIN